VVSFWAGSYWKDYAAAPIDSTQFPITWQSVFKGRRTGQSASK
jgi:hypothetical protein